MSEESSTRIPKIDIVYNKEGDWTILFLDGKRAYSAHSIDSDTLLDCLKIPVTVHEINLDGKENIQDLNELLRKSEPIPLDLLPGRAYHLV